jgi:hypothetical protein
MKNAAGALLSFGVQLMSTQSGYGSLRTKMVSVRISPGSAQMQTGETSWLTAVQNSAFRSGQILI